MRIKCDRAGESASEEGGRGKCFMSRKQRAEPHCSWGLILPGKSSSAQSEEVTIWLSLLYSVLLSASQGFQFKQINYPALWALRSVAGHMLGLDRDSYRAG